VSTDPIGDYFARMMPDALKWFEDQAAAGPELPAGGFMIPPELRSEILATKLSATLLVSDELLHPRQFPPPTWRTRLRWKLASWREQAARRAFKVIAGYWPDDGEDDW
jgi:hypothetical protein